MKTSAQLLYIAIAAATLTGCFESKEPVQTVDWFKENAAERKAQIAKCNANPGELAAKPNCINATTAANRLTLENRSYPKLVPLTAAEMGFAPPEKRPETKNRPAGTQVDAKKP